MHTDTAAGKAAFTVPDLAALLAVALIWGLNNLFAKLAVDAMPPLLSCGFRFLFALAALIPWLRIPKTGWPMLACVALLTGLVHQGIQYAGLALAKDLTPMVIAMQLWIPASVAFAALLLRERIGAWRIAGIGAAFGGIAVMAGDPGMASQLGALALVALAAAIYAAAAVLVRRAPPVHPLTYQAWIAAFAAPGLFLSSAAFEHDQMAAIAATPWTIWAAVAFGGLGSSVVANAWMFHPVQRYEVSRTTPFLFISPLVGVGLGIAVLKDPVTPQLLLGGAFTLVGVALVALAERRGR